MHKALLELRDKWAAGFGQTDEGKRRQAVGALEEMVQVAMDLNSSDALAGSKGIQDRIIQQVFSKWREHAAKAIGGNPRDGEVMFLCESWLRIGLLLLDGIADQPDLPQLATDCAKLLTRNDDLRKGEYLVITQLFRDCYELHDQVLKKQKEREVGH